MKKSVLVGLALLAALNVNAEVVTPEVVKAVIAKESNTPYSPPIIEIQTDFLIKGKTHSSFTASGVAGLETPQTAGQTTAYISKCVKTSSGTSLSTETVFDGVASIVRPISLDGDRLLMQFNGTLSELKGFKIISANGCDLQLPEVEIHSLNQTLILEKGKATDLQMGNGRIARITYLRAYN